MFDQALQDLRHACRVVVRRPVFSLVVVGSLGIAIGANAAIFDLARSLFFGALPIEAPNRVAG